MKSTSKKGLTSKPGSFPKYSGNIKSEGGKASAGHKPRKSGGSAKSNVNSTKKVVRKKSVY